MNVIRRLLVYFIVTITLITMIRMYNFHIYIQPRANHLKLKNNSRVKAVFTQVINEVTTSQRNVSPKAKHVRIIPKDIGIYLQKHKDMCRKDWANKIVPQGSKPLCDCIPDTLLGFQPVNISYAPPEETVQRNEQLTTGGHWEPANCTARYKVTVIIPYRGRHNHLSVLLHHLHPKLRGQQLNYTVLVIEQNLPKTFNKAALMNIGYKYAMEMHKPDCVIFHDVDIIPEDGRHFYTCRHQPLHIGAYNNRHMYKIIYSSIFGGATSFRPSTFEKINGFSNRFFGWGGEDDEMGTRVRENGLKIIRDPRAVAGYTIIKHARDKGNIQHDRQDMVHKLFHNRSPRQDGLNSLRFNCQKNRLFPLYTWYLVDVLNDET